MRLDWLADEMRAWGLDVVEVAGWRTRGADNLDPSVIVCHHTASNAGSGDIPALNILVNGRSDVPGPLSQIGLARSGKVYIIASGTSNNAGQGSFAGVTGNRHTIGIEAENNGLGEPWGDAQVDAYHRVVAALCSRSGIPVEMVCGHKEWTTRKIDPAGIDMDQFRAAVAELLKPPPAPTPLPTEDDMPILVIDPNERVWLLDGLSRMQLTASQKKEAASLYRITRTMPISGDLLGRYIDVHGS